MDKTTTHTKVTGFENVLSIFETSLVDFRFVYIFMETS